MYLVLDNIRSAHNGVTLFRVCDALGTKEIRTLYRDPKKVKEVNGYLILLSSNLIANLKSEIRV